MSVDEKHDFTMEQLMANDSSKEGPINFKALRAKFQEEAALAQAKNSRPAIADKPKRLPPSGGHCGSVMSAINTAVEEKTPLPRVIFRDGLRASGGKRPISFPPQPQLTSLPSQSGGGVSTTRQSLINRHMPLVLPVLPVKEQKTEPAAANQQKPKPESLKGVPPPIKAKKKGLLLPFKSTKASKVSVLSGEEPTYADLTIRPASAPGELPSMEREKTEDRLSLQGDQSTTECSLSSSDVPISPPSTDASEELSSGTGANQGFDQRVVGTLGRAKKKFSPRQLLIYARPKSFRPNGVRTADGNPADKNFHLSLKDVERIKPDLPVPPPVCLPHLAFVSARPFFKTNGSARKPALDKQFYRNSALSPPLGPNGPPLLPPTPPLKKALPDLRLLGPLPVKPPRPPWIDLSSYYPTPPQVVLPHVDHVPREEPEPEPLSFTNPVLNIPQFPDFNHSEMETAENGSIDIAALELEALEFDNVELPAPADFGVSNVEAPESELPVRDPAEPVSLDPLDLGLNLENYDLMPPNPAVLPDPLNLTELPEPVVPELWSQNEVPAPFLEPQADDADQAVSVEAPSTTEEENGEERSQTSVQQESYYEASDNVYEDVENINKLICSQNSRKRKGGLKNPHSDSHPAREEARRNIWPRNPWGEHGHAHGHRERHSPETAEYKEQKKRVKQRLEKEKKEQKEREKKENEMKKKFKALQVTGLEEPMYHAKVMVASKVRKNDLPVKSGDMVSIIRTTNCPKGKWLAQDANKKYGYISVMNVELNIKEMLELGKKAQAAGRAGEAEGDAISIGSRCSNQPMLTSSFSDDSEEWTCEEETLSLSTESRSFQHNPTISMPETLCGHASAQPNLSDVNLEDLHTQNRQEALQKLAIFFEHNKNGLSDSTDNEDQTPTNAEPPSFLAAVEEPAYHDLEADLADLELLPPPSLYADTF